MKEKLKKIESEILEKIPKTKSIQELEDIRVGVLGKKGELKNILKAMGGLSNEERPVIGKMANEIRENIQNALEEAKKKINQEEQLKKLKEEKIDVTIPGNYTASGHRHPLMQVKEQLEDLFLSMGFDVIDGPEIDTVENNFDALNAPVDHPSRDKSDTFYFSDDLI